MLLLTSYVGTYKKTTCSTVYYKLFLTGICIDNKHQVIYICNYVTQYKYFPYLQELNEQLHDLILVAHLVMQTVVQQWVGCLILLVQYNMIIQALKLICQQNKIALCDQILEMLASTHNYKHVIQFAKTQPLMHFRKT